MTLASDGPGVRDLEIAAHSVLTVLHGLAAIWHFRRRSWANGIVHLGGVVYDGLSLVRHLRRP